MAEQIGILLINLGTPDAPTEDAVRRYLDEFLMDPYVIDIPAPIRFALVKGIILRTRPKQSAEAYEKIWTTEGSPLLTYGRALTKKLDATTDENTHVALGMRYGNPSVGSALQTLMEKQLDRLIVLPLFPQYSLAATESAIQFFHRAYRRLKCKLPFKMIRDFYAHPSFIEANVALIKPHINEKTDCLLLSYHGLPVKHLKKAGCQQVGKHCIGDTPCPMISHSNQDCYRAQCHATSRAITQALGIADNKVVSSFQSRLGKTPWIKPYTDLLLPELYQKGIRNLVVACPSFVADCLETIEEIGMQACEQWAELGGETFTLVPCVNDSPSWVSNIQEILF